MTNRDNTKLIWWPDDADQRWGLLYIPDGVDGSHDDDLVCWGRTTPGFVLAISCHYNDGGAGDKYHWAVSCTRPDVGMTSQRGGCESTLRDARCAAETATVRWAADLAGMSTVLALSPRRFHNARNAAFLYNRGLFPYFEEAI